MGLKDVRSIVLVTVGLVALALSHHQGSINPLQFSPPTSDSLRCQEVLKITLWGMSKHGGSVTGKLDAPETIDKALTLFVEKVDPFKILYTSSEVEDFKSGGKRVWLSLLNGHSCGFFSAWLDSTYPVVQTRLKRTVQELSFSKGSQPTSGRNKPPLSKPKSWATNEVALKTRVETVGLEIVSSSPKSVLGAYEGKWPELVSSSLEENVLIDAPKASALLAKSLLGTLDPYTTYLSSSEFDDFYSDLSGGTSGIGIRIRKVPTGLLIEDIVEDSAASHSGKIKKNDIIVRVDGVNTESLSMREVKKLLKGPEDSEVTLEIKKDDSREERVELKRTRFDFEEAKVSSKVVPGKNGTTIGIISIPGFYGNVGFTEQGSIANSSAEDLRTILEKFTEQAKKPEAVVLDLRGNPGGFLEEAVTMASFFLGSKPVVGVVEKDNTRILKEEFQDAVYNGKLVVLVDHGTASAAEVLAGALGDLQRAIIVGTPHTYGKGTVQKLFSLDDELLELGLTQKNGNGVLKLTTSVFYSPLGHSPANGGIKSDIVLPDSMMVSKEDYGTAPSMAIKEEKPFLDEATVLELQLKQEMHKGLIHALKELSAARLKLHSNGAPEDKAVTEASSIAGDLIKHERSTF